MHNLTIDRAADRSTPSDARAWAVRLYTLNRKLLRRIFVLLDAFVSGIWLGAFRRADLYAVDEAFYARAPQYYDETYNRSGLSGWEARMIADFFGGCQSLLVGSVGGGREAVALLERGFAVDAFECNPRLAEHANELLSKLGYAGDVVVAPRDEVPPGPPHDGAVVGWGAYTLIAGRDRRIAFLRQLHGRVVPGGPVLISFFHRDERERRFRLIARIAGFARLLLRGRRVELGDSLSPNYTHHFTEREIAAELAAAGFEMVHHDVTEYAHAVARAARAPGTVATES